MKISFFYRKNANKWCQRN